MGFKPIDDRILIEPIEEVVSTGTIKVPDTIREKPRSGKVLAVGNDSGEFETAIGDLIHVGDIVAFDKYAGQEIKVDDKKRMVIARVDVLGVIEQ